MTNITSIRPTETNYGQLAVRHIPQYAVACEFASGGSGRDRRFLLHHGAWGQYLWFSRVLTEFGEPLFFCRSFPWALLPADSCAR